MKRSLHLTADLLRVYSRRGNYHSEPDAAAEIGYSRLVAQGMQVAGPAYGLLLDAWGESFLAAGTVELKFVGMVVDDETVDAEVTFSGPSAAATTADLTVRCGDRTAVVGRATRGAS
jgi:acyl dehydratase